MTLSGCPFLCGARTRLQPFSCSFSHVSSYYGLVLDLQNLGNDIVLLQVLFGAVDLLARSITAFLLSFLGRRTTLASFQAMAGLSILANKLVPQGEAEAAWRRGGPSGLSGRQLGPLASLAVPTGLTPWVRPLPGPENMAPPSYSPRHHRPPTHSPRGN